LHWRWLTTSLEETFGSIIQRTRGKERCSYRRRSRRIKPQKWEKNMNEEVPDHPEPPSKMPVFSQYAELYSSPDKLHIHGWLQQFVEAAYRISKHAIDHGMETWTLEDAPQSSGTEDKKATNCRKGYEVARGCIDNSESEDLNSFSKIISTITVQTYTSIIEKMTDPIQKVFEMYKQATYAKQHVFDPKMNQAAEKTNCKFHPAGVKGILRLSEKLIMRPEAGMIWDPLRAMVVGNMKELSDFVNELRKDDTIYFVGCNDRFFSPTDENWQDCALYIMFKDARCNGIVAEIQLVHPRFLDIREKFGAHDAYDSLRFAAEVRKLKNKQISRGLPDSLRKTLV